MHYSDMMNACLFIWNIFFRNTRLETLKYIYCQKKRLQIKYRNICSVSVRFLLAKNHINQSVNPGGLLANIQKEIRSNNKNK